MPLRTRSKAIRPEGEGESEATTPSVTRRRTAAASAAAAASSAEGSADSSSQHFHPPSHSASRFNQQSRIMSPSRRSSPRRPASKPAITEKNDPDLELSKQKHQPISVRPRPSPMRPQEGIASGGSSSARSSPPQYQQRGLPHHSYLHHHPGGRAYMSSRDYINTEIDAVKDDFGPSIIDCLNMGSFAEDDSPPRNTARRKQGTSPPHPSLYGSYPPLRSPATYPPPHHVYYQGYPSFYPPSRYQPPHDQGNWSPPSSYGYGDHARSEQVSQPASPPPKKARWSQSTPEKKTGPSPFRSPPEEQKYKKSPLFHGTPSIGGFGSFGVDTPGGSGHLGDFSPMGPSFANFDSLGNLRLSKSSSGEDMYSSEKPVIHQRRSSRPEGYAESLMGDVLSPFVGNIQIQGSPLRGMRSERNPMPTRPSSMKKAAITPMTKSRFTFSSPVGSRLGNLTYNDSKAPGPVRLELGDMSTKRYETSKGLEGINSMLRGESSRHPTPASAHLPRRQPHSRLPAANLVREPIYAPHPRMETPIKIHYPHVTPSGNRGAVSYQQSSDSRKQSPSTAVTPTLLPGSGNRKGPRFDKENLTPKVCNCKKSNCLKLYCVCFAAEQYCNGCNCNDCRNTKDYDDLRGKAMKDCRNKNPNAFKSKFDHGRIIAQGPPGASPQSIHNMGCKCKKSECLKKYCECFQNGVMCGSKCKCVDCLNYGGSQALIDKRRKIKDHRGAEIAMRVADEAWKGKHAPPVSAAPPTRKNSPIPSPAQGDRRSTPQSLHPPPMKYPHPSGHIRRQPLYAQPHYMAPPIGYPHGTPNYIQGSKSMMHSQHTGNRLIHPPYAASRRPQRLATQKTPKTPAIRRVYDPKGSKKRKLKPGTQEQTFPYFGRVPEQPKTNALVIFSFLTNDEMYNAGLVCKRWSRLAIDEELWELPQF